MIRIRKYFFLLKRFIRLFNKNFLFNTFINFLFLSSIIFCFTTIVLTTSINEGFKKDIQEKIINLDGYARIYSNHSLPLKNSEFTIIKKILSDEYKNIEYTQLINSEIILKTSNGSEGLFINLFDNNGMNVFNLNDFIIEGDFKKDELTIGSSLAKKLSININDDIYLFNYKNNNVRLVKVSAIFETNIADYDKHTIYADIYSFKDFLDYSFDAFDCVVINSKQDNFEVNNIVKNNDFITVTWEDRFSNFLLWLFSYDIPIKVLLLFIFIVSLLNISSSIYLDLLYNNKNNTLLYIFGLTKQEFIYMYLFKNVYIYLIGSFLSYILIKIFIYIQLSYDLISIPKSIYMLSSVPINFDVNYFIYLFSILLACIIFITLLFSILTITFNNPSKLIKK